VIGKTEIVVRAKVDHLLAVEDKSGPLVALYTAKLSVKPLLPDGIHLCLEEISDHCSPIIISSGVNQPSFPVKCGTEVSYLCSLFEPFLI